jgi:hypothetical protein
MKFCQFLGRKYFYGATFELRGLEIIHLAAVTGQSCQAAASLLGRLFQNPGPVGDPFNTGKFFNQPIIKTNTVMTIQNE